MDTSKQLLCVLEILKELTEAGAEIYRVEESAKHIFFAYGYRRVDVYATTSNIIVSLEDGNDNAFTHTRRIGDIATDIDRIDRLNKLIRDIERQKPSVEQLKKMHAEALSGKRYSRALGILFYGVIAGVFYLFFGGRSAVEFVLSFAIGISSGVLSLVKFNKLLKRFLCAFFACTVAFLFKRFNLIGSVDSIIIANIMTLIPGIGLTNALRDLFVGDSISGVLRLIEAMLMAVAIACGYMVTCFLFGGAL